MMVLKMDNKEELIKLTVKQIIQIFMQNGLRRLEIGEVIGLLLDAVKESDDYVREKYKDDPDKVDKFFRN
jgi:hypothetical protein